jgi:uncharacterized damage-inducible protein DinB
VTNIDDHGRPEPPISGNEVDTLLGYLDYQRATLEWKTRGLDEAGLRRTIASSTMTLAGLLKHMAYVEDQWFSGMLLDLPRMSPWDAVDWAATPDWEWESAAREPADVVRAQWSTSVERSRAVVRDVLSRASDATTTGDATTGDSLGTLAKRSWPNGERPSLRWILVHMIEEYARHNGHADLLREAVDGETGE